MPFIILPSKKKVVEIQSPTFHQQAAPVMQNKKLDFLFPAAANQVTALQ
jgi:hypothetical protein